MRFTDPTGLDPDVYMDDGSGDDGSGGGGGGPSGADILADPSAFGLGYDAASGASSAGCSLNGINTPCGLLNSVLSAGAGAVCPNNVCTMHGTDPYTGQPAYLNFTAGAGGATGYLSSGDITQGVNEVNGSFLSNSQYNAYVQSTFASQIDAQRRGLAQAIADKSGGTISYAQAYASLGVDNGHVQGGNYNFVETTFGPGDLICGADASRCNGIHFPGAGFVHLDTSNPFTGPLGLFEHGFVDVFLGNIAYTVIPRPWP